MHLRRRSNTLCSAVDALSIRGYVCIYFSIISDWPVQCGSCCIFLPSLSSLSLQLATSSCYSIACHSIAYTAQHSMYLPTHSPVQPVSLAQQPSQSATTAPQFLRLLDICHECILRGDAVRARRAYSLLLRSGRSDWATDWRDGMRHVAQDEDRARFLREVLAVHSRREKKGKQRGGNYQRREVSECRRASERSEQSEASQKGKGSPPLGLLLLVLL